MCILVWINLDIGFFSPEEWPELSLTEKLNEIANLDEYVFCHQNRTSVRCSEEAAVKMCRIAKEIYSSKTKK